MRARLVVVAALVGCKFAPTAMGSHASDATVEPDAKGDARVVHDSSPDVGPAGFELVQQGINFADDAPGLSVTLSTAPASGD